MSFWSFLSIGLCATYARWVAGRKRLVGLEFDNYGRELAIKDMWRKKSISLQAVHNLLNPVSCVRYYEFSCLIQAIRKKIGEGDETTALKILDISSPRLFPFFMADKLHADILMVNPDNRDLTTSMAQLININNPGKIKFERNINATSLPYKDSTFDFVTSISVIEHIYGNGDSLMIEEVERTLKPKGLALISFPVKPIFEEEYRSSDIYDLQKHDFDRDSYFFQRFYDKESIENRLVSESKMLEIDRTYFVEHPVDWFASYEKEWTQKGIAITARDSSLMSVHFRDNGEQHPLDRMGICCLVLEKR